MITIEIQQGSTYGLSEPATIAIPGDFTGWQAKGEIKSNYRGRFFASWEFEELIYNDETDKTLISFWLGAIASAKIPLPEYWEDSKIIIGKTVWVTEIKLFDPEDLNLVIPIMQAIIKVIPEV